MQARSADTDPEAEEVLFDRLRRAGGTRRVQMALTLSAQRLGMARRAVREAAPDATDTEIGILFVERVYGRELAAEPRRHLAARQP